MVSEKMVAWGSQGCVIRDLAAYGEQRAAVVGAENVFNFTIGNPSVPAPSCVRQTIEHLLQTVPAEQLHAYTAAPGLASVRAKMAAYLEKTFGVGYRAEDVYMTSGASSALAMLAYALLSPGDEVLTLSPYFSEYKLYAEAAGGTLTAVPSNPEDFQIDLDAFSAAISEKTAIVLLNSPNNPSGVILSRRSITKLAELLGIKKLWVKDDGQNPTASLKDRASAMAVAKAMEAGAKTIACSSTGNAASSLAGNAAAAGIKTYIFVPERAPKGKVAQLMIFGANVISVKGNYEETFKMSAAAIDKYGWYNRNAAINPYLSEGKKTVALEIAEQLNWEMPDYLAISVGDGCTIAGVWKGFKDLYAIGFIDKLPRLISGQSLGCYPINRAIQENKPWEPMEENTIADSISVGVPRNADKALMAIRESNGLAINVTDEEILAAQKLLGRTCGVFGEPAGVTGTAAVKKACELGLIEKGATVVSVVTGNGLKDVANAIKSAGEPIHIAPDLELMVEEFKKRGVTVE